MPETYIRIQNVAVGVDVTNFMTPDWDRVLRLYPRWRDQVKKNGDDPWDIQPYMLVFAKELERCGREGLVSRHQTQDEWMQRYMQHFGLGHLADVVECSKEQPWKIRLWCSSMKADVPSPSGSIYGLDVLQGIVDFTKKAVDEGASFAQLGVHDGTKVQLKNVAGRVDKVVLVDGVLGADIQVLSTPAGLVLAKLCEYPERLGLVPLMMGDKDEATKRVSNLLVFGWAVLCKEADLPLP